MIENVKTDKKVWVAPVIEVIDIEQTLGGPVTVINEAITTNFGKGTVPSP